MKTITFLILLNTSLFNPGCRQPENEIETEMINIRRAVPDKPLTEILDSMKIDKDLLTIHIDKSEFSLQLRVDGLIIKSYPLVLGENPVDDKKMEGDKCTPEGEFELRALYPHKKWNYFLWIDYPTADSWKKHNAAKENGTIPAIASIGGEIGIHGVPESKDNLIDEQINWTAGCISLKNKDVEEIYKAVHVGTRVSIVK